MTFDSKEVCTLDIVLYLSFCCSLFLIGSHCSLLESLLFSSLLEDDNEKAWVRERG